MLITLCIINVDNTNLHFKRIFVKNVLWQTPKTVINDSLISKGLKAT